MGARIVERSRPRAQAGVGCAAMREEGNLLDRIRLALAGDGAREPGTVYGVGGVFAISGSSRRRSRVVNREL
jgi:hypothetical protein